MRRKKNVKHFYCPALFAVHFDSFQAFLPFCRLSYVSMDSVDTLPACGAVLSHHRLWSCSASYGDDHVSIFSNDFPKFSHTLCAQCWFQWPHGLRCGSAATRLPDCGFESRRGHGYLAFVTVVFCQVKVSVSDWSLLQSPTECGVSECDHEALAH
jgi:hypothetical protein